MNFAFCQAGWKSIVYSQTIRPQLVSKADGEVGQAIDVTEMNERTAEACMPIEDDEKVQEEGSRRRTSIA